MTNNKHWISAVKFAKSLDPDVVIKITANSIHAAGLNEENSRKFKEYLTGPKHRKEWKNSFMILVTGIPRPPLLIK